VVSSKDSFKIYNYCRESKVYGKTGMTKWFKMAEEHVIYRFIEYHDFEDYSSGEIIKLIDYDKITDMIIGDILSNIDINQPTKIGIEGYSFASGPGDLIDLVTFSTLLRKKLYDKVSKDILVISPSTLKLESCKLTYPPIKKETGKRKKTVKLEYRNRIGMPGGKFIKSDMYLSIIENDNLVDYWANHCRSIRGDVGININKPYEDANDAYLLYQILKKQNPL
jgi:hypothetical protein